jgi:hypothetical protein
VEKDTSSPESELATILFNVLLELEESLMPLLVLEVALRLESMLLELE